MMTGIFITVAVLAIAFIFYQVGYNHGEMDGYTNAVSDGWDVK